jgi:beta-phosphoglucomutase family hydrolase
MDDPRRGDPAQDATKPDQAEGSRSMLKAELKGVVFDLDGVITDTVKLHRQAWEKMFNEFLKERAETEKEPFNPFDPFEDFQKYVAGKPRFEGVMRFLKSRGIQLPYGQDDDPEEAKTICGLGNKKNGYFQEALKAQGPEVYDASVAFVKSLKESGVKVGVATSSQNCKLILELAGLSELFETRVDGQLSKELGLSGKPEPDIFVQAARDLGLTPGECVMVEDSITGVQAGAKGNFGLVIGAARTDDGQLLQRFGADVVVADMGELCVADLRAWFEENLEEANWRLQYFGFDPGDEKLRETLTTVGNGYLGTRGCFETETASFSFYPGTYIAGIYNKVPSEVHGRTIYNNDFVNCPNWLLVEFRIGNGPYQSPMSMDLLHYAETLDMRRGVLHRALVCRDKLGRITRIMSRRFASMENPHLCALEFSVTPVNYTSRLAVRSSLDGNVENQGVARYRELTSKHLDLVSSGQDDGRLLLRMVTSSSRYEIVMRASHCLKEDGKSVASERFYEKDNARISEVFTFEARENMTYTLEKLVAVHTSLDQDEPDPVQGSAQTLDKVKSFQSAWTPHKRAWKSLWKRADIRVEADRFVQRTLRLHIHHLLVTASPHNVMLDVGMPARGLHGEAYRGHIFWDEIFILPFFILHFPAIAKALLMYRYRRLDAARDYAKQNGFEGAMYPWQTSDDGAEDTQELHYNPANESWGPDLSRRQRHVSIAVFFNVWEYVFCSGDNKFLQEAGAEMMLEIARFWASIAEYDPGDGRYHIAGIMGPDEFHEKLPGASEPGLKDNAYTNIMVAWLMERALELLDTVPKKRLDAIFSKINFREEETQKWRDMATSMNVIMTDEGLISQFDGYMDLDELDWDHYRKRYYNIHRMDRILKAEGDSPDHYKVAKQADVLMTFYVLPPEEVGRILEKLGYDPGDPYELLQRNYDYYEKRTSHGSTLSKIVHAIVASYLPDVPAWDWFMEAMESDIYDTQGGTTIEGIHTGVMAGTIDLVLRYFAGIDLCGKKLSVHPTLPDDWKALSFELARGRVRFDVVENHDGVRIMVRGNGDKTRPAEIMGKTVDLESGREVFVPAR